MYIMCLRMSMCMWMWMCMRIVHCGHCALPPVGANCSQLTLQLTHTHILGAPQVKNQLSNYLVFSTNIILRQALKYILILCSLLRCYCVKNLHGKYFNIHWLHSSHHEQTSWFLMSAMRFCKIESYSINRKFSFSLWNGERQLMRWNHMFDSL